MQTVAHLYRPLIPCLSAFLFLLCLTFLAGSERESWNGPKMVAMSHPAVPKHNQPVYGSYDKNRKDMMMLAARNAILCFGFIAWPTIVSAFGRRK